MNASTKLYPPTEKDMNAFKAVLTHIERHERVHVFLTHTVSFVEAFMSHCVERHERLNKAVHQQRKT